MIASASPTAEDINAALFSDKGRLARTLISYEIPERFWGDVVQAVLAECIRTLYLYRRQVSLVEWVYSVLFSVLRVPEELLAA